MKIFYSKNDLITYVDGILSSGWQFDAPLESMRDKLVDMVYWMNTPLWGEDWSEFLQGLIWEPLIAEADEELAAERQLCVV